MNFKCGDDDYSGDCHRHSSWQILSLCTTLPVTTLLQRGDIGSHWVLNLANHILYSSSGISAQVEVDTRVRVLPYETTLTTSVKISIQDVQKPGGIEVAHADSTALESHYYKKDAPLV